MKQTWTFCSILLPAVLLFSGCADTSPGTGTMVGSTAVGAGTGAAIGALATRGDPFAVGVGALAGAAAGAATGYGINESNRSQTAYPVAKRTRSNPNYVISPFDGTELYVGGAPDGARLRDPRGRVFVVGSSNYPVARRSSNPDYVISPFNGRRLFVGDASPGTRMKDPEGHVFIVGQ